MAPPIGTHLGVREGPAECWPLAALLCGASEETPGSQAWSTADSRQNSLCHHSSSKQNPREATSILSQHLIGTGTGERREASH